MRDRVSSRRWTWLVWAFFIGVSFISAQDKPQDESAHTREIWDTTLLSKRPAGRTSPTPKAPSVTGDDSLVGITVWRLRPSQSGDQAQVRELLHEDNGSLQFTPERIAANTALRDGEKVRISIETARTGYLYVIDREGYADGSKGDPFLIFPNLRIQGGENAVKAGAVVEIPSPGDSPPFFRVHQSRPDQTNEDLMILVTSKPIPEVRVGRERLVLSKEQVAQWEKQWKAEAYRLEAVDLVGKPTTLAEKEAGSDGKMLTQNDPLPQTMYHCEAAPGNPLLVELPLQISK
jgi:hypothetical protein